MHCKQPIYYPPNVLLEFSQTAHAAKVDKFVPDFFTFLKPQKAKFKSANDPKVCSNSIKRNPSEMPKRKRKKETLYCFKDETKIGHYKKKKKTFNSFLFYTYG